MKLNVPKNLNNNLRLEYESALHNKEFNDLVTKYKITEDMGYNKTSKLLDCLEEKHNCEHCKNLFDCQNKIKGSILVPNVMNNQVYFLYQDCKYKKDAIENENNKANVLDKARIKDIDITDKNRVKLIKWIKNFYDNYDPSKGNKGLFLHGSFGVGKTYLLACLLNELKTNKHIQYELIYYPEILRTLKEDWDFFAARMNRYQNVEILLIDDIGAEKVSDWSRDEILGTILQYRMNNNLTTFFTSNLNIDELERHLSVSNNTTDLIKARRIIERIKQLTEDLELITTNKRK